MSMDTLIGKTYFNRLSPENRLFAVSVPLQVRRADYGIRTIPIIIDRRVDTIAMINRTCAYRGGPMHSSLASWITVSCFFAVIFSPVSAGTIVVPDQFRSIRKALEEAETNDTVLVRAGVYRENLVMPDRIVLRGEHVDKTILRGDRKNPVVVAANHSTIENLTIERGGIGILSENTNMKIQRTVIRENEKTGIQCLLSLPHIRNNIIAGNQWSGIFCELISFGRNTAIEHNILSENGYNGVMLSNGSSVLVKNNVLYNNRQFGIHVSENSRRSRIIYNCFYRNRKPYNYYAVVDQTNIGKDPAFPAKPGLSYTAVAGYDSPLSELGKDDLPMGLIGKEQLAALQVDSDGDAIIDREDLCPQNAEDMDGFEDKDGCPDFDNDFDGIYDQLDKCPDQSEDFDGYSDSDGCPEADNDEDGIEDENDKCPNTPETDNDYKDEDGCPDETPR
ncbi:MAG: DUF1565 domain-containing protein [Chitinivibrionales bacterium]|nr:DUF1565 domain-containing protein [Chitinivibrionales bacterium]MBD3355544.1 DUF1565 domain-containing protein [Chitinivibrionales bacterium]